MFHFNKIYDSIPFLLQGALVTLQYTFISFCIGLIIGIALALMRISKHKILTWISKFYISIFLGTPLIVQLSIIYYATPQIFNYDITAFQAGLLAFSLNSSAYVAEIIRAGIESVDKGQFEAASSLGIPYYLMMKDIILPQALKNILPALVNEAINLLKESAIISFIGEMDLLRRANIVAAEKYIYFEPLIFIAIIYYVLVIALSKVASLLEIRLKRSD